MLAAKPVEPVSIHPCIKHPQIITIYKSGSNEDMVTDPVSSEGWFVQLKSLMTYRGEKQLE
jgi:hypothetical protein